MISPSFGLRNHGYQTLLDDPTTRALFKGAMQTLFDVAKINVPGSGAAGCDDMLAWFRTLGFLDDPEFVHAMQPYAEDKTLLGRLWRIYTLCWAARSCMALPGSYVDLGAYDGRTVDVMRRYCEFDTADKQWWLYDAYDHHPAGRNKNRHGPELASQVATLFPDKDHYWIMAGLLPDLLMAQPQEIAFMQVDLNHAETEVACLERLWPRVVPGGIVILDDYGAAEHRRSYELEKAFFEQRGQSVLELPTSQGMVVKR